MKNKVKVKKQDFKSFLLGQIQKQEEFYKKFGFDVNFYDLSERIKRRKFFDSNWSQKDIFVVIPEGWDQEKALSMLRVIYRVEKRSVLGFSTLENEREGNKNYLISFSFPVDGTHQNGEPINFIERIMLEVAFFSKKNKMIDGYIKKPLLCLGSKNYIKYDSINNTLYPFLEWSKKDGIMILDHALEANGFLDIGRVNIIN